jgi:hypothetical protein
MKIDPYNHKEIYITWKEKNKGGIPDLSMINSDIVFKYINDMECGLNVSATNKKGARSYVLSNISDEIREILGDSLKK